MEFHIKLAGAIADLDALEHAIGAVDPSVVIDVDPTGPTLRVAASIDAIQLVLLLAQAGYPVAHDQVVQVPSICCGGCSA